MTNASPLERAARRVTGFEHKYSARHDETYGKNLLYLACHAALPAALSTDLLHLLRINFFFENTEQLPYTAEADLLLSPLCTEIGDELYEMDHEVRDILLQKLTDKYGRERLSEVAKLLWQYDQRFAPWADRDMLERAQQLTALSFLDPARARQWLAQQSTDHYSLEQRVWFTAVNKEVLLAKKLLPLPTEQLEPAVEVQAANDGEKQTQPAPTERVERSAAAPPDVSHSEASEDQQPLMTEESASVSSSSQEFPADLSTTSTSTSSQEQQQIAKIDRSRLHEAILQSFNLEGLTSLYYDLTEILHHDGINVSTNLDMLGGTNLREKVQRLIDYCERRGILEILVRVVLRDRPNLASKLLGTEQEPPSNVQRSISEKEELIAGDKERRISGELYNKLVGLVLKTPGISNFASRSALLIGISNGSSLLRNSSNSYADISGLVSQLSMIRLRDGRSALLVFIDNVLLRLEGMMEGEQLEEMRRQLEEFYEEKEQEPSFQEQSLEAHSSQTKTNASKKTNFSKEKEIVSGGEHMTSQSENEPDRILALGTYRKLIEDIEYTLSMTSPRMLTSDTLIVYEEKMYETLEKIRKTSSLEIYPYMHSKDGVIDNIRDARDELALAIQELTEKGRNREFISYIRRCCRYLEDALEGWSR